MTDKKKNRPAGKKPAVKNADPGEPEKPLTPPERYYEKPDLQTYEGFVGMIDRMFFKLTGKTSDRTPEEEAEMRAKFDKMQADNEKKKQQQGQD
jgi:hypothetical protein